MNQAQVGGGLVMTAQGEDRSVSSETRLTDLMEKLRYLRSVVQEEIREIDDHIDQHRMSSLNMSSTTSFVEPSSSVKEAEGRDEEEEQELEAAAAATATPVSPSGNTKTISSICSTTTSSDTSESGSVSSSLSPLRGISPSPTHDEDVEERPIAIIQANLAEYNESADSVLSAPMTMTTATATTEHAAHDFTSSSATLLWSADASKARDYDETRHGGAHPQEPAGDALEPNKHLQVIDQRLDADDDDDDDDDSSYDSQEEHPNEEPALSALENAPGTTPLVIRSNQDEDRPSCLRQISMSSIHRRHTINSDLQSKLMTFVETRFKIPAEKTLASSPGDPAAPERSFSHPLRAESSRSLTSFLFQEGDQSVTDVLQDMDEKEITTLSEWVDAIDPASAMTSNNGKTLNSNSWSPWDNGLSNHSNHSSNTISTTDKEFFANWPEWGTPSLPNQREIRTAGPSMATSPIARTRIKLERLDSVLEENVADGGDEDDSTESSETSSSEDDTKSFASEDDTKSFASEDDTKSFASEDDESDEDPEENSEEEEDDEQDEQQMQDEKDSLEEESMAELPQHTKPSENASAQETFNISSEQLWGEEALTTGTRLQQHHKGALQHSPLRQPSMMSLSSTGSGTNSFSVASDGVKFQPTSPGSVSSSVSGARSAPGSAARYLRGTSASGHSATDTCGARSSTSSAYSRNNKEPRLPYQYKPRAGAVTSPYRSKNRTSSYSPPGSSPMERIRGSRYSNGTNRPYSRSPGKSGSSTGGSSLESSSLSPTERGSERRSSLSPTERRSSLSPGERRSPVSPTEREIGRRLSASPPERGSERGNPRFRMSPRPTTFSPPPRSVFSVGTNASLAHSLAFSVHSAETVPTRIGFGSSGSISDSITHNDNDNCHERQQMFQKKVTSKQAAPSSSRRTSTTGQDTRGPTNQSSYFDDDDDDDSSSSSASSSTSSRSDSASESSRSSSDGDDDHSDDNSSSGSSSSSGSNSESSEESDGSSSSSSSGEQDAEEEYEVRKEPQDDGSEEDTDDEDDTVDDEEEDDDTDDEEEDDEPSAVVKDDDPAEDNEINAAQFNADFDVGAGDAPWPELEEQQEMKGAIPSDTFIPRTLETQDTFDDDDYEGDYDYEDEPSVIRELRAEMEEEDDDDDYDDDDDGDDPTVIKELRVEARFSLDDVDDDDDDDYDQDDPTIIKELRAEAEMDDSSSDDEPSVIKELRAEAENEDEDSEDEPTVIQELRIEAALDEDDDDDDESETNTYTRELIASVQDEIRASQEHAGQDTGEDGRWMEEPYIEEQQDEEYNFDRRQERGFHRQEATPRAEGPVRRRGGGGESANGKSEDEESECTAVLLAELRAELGIDATDEENPPRDLKGLSSDQLWEGESESPSNMQRRIMAESVDGTSIPRGSQGSRASSDLNPQYTPSLFAPGCQPQHNMHLSRVPAKLIRQSHGGQEENELFPAEESFSQEESEHWRSRSQSPLNQSGPGGHLQVSDQLELESAFHKIFMSEDDSGFASPARFASPTAAFEAQMDFSEPEVAFETTEDFATPAEFETSPDFEHPTEFETPVDFTSPALAFEASADYAGPGAMFEAPTDFENPADFGPPADYTDPNAMFEAHADFDDPPDTFGPPVDYTDPNAMFEAPVDFDDPPDAFESPADYDPHDIFEAPTDYDDRDAVFDTTADFAHSPPMFGTPTDFTGPATYETTMDFVDSLFQQEEQSEQDGVDYYQEEEDDVKLRSQVFQSRGTMLREPSMVGRMTGALREPSMANLGMHATASPHHLASMHDHQHYDDNEYDEDDDVEEDDGRGAAFVAQFSAISSGGGLGLPSDSLFPNEPKLFRRRMMERVDSFKNDSTASVHSGSSSSRRSRRKVGNSNGAIYARLPLAQEEDSSFASDSDLMLNYSRREMPRKRASLMKRLFKRKGQF